MTLDQWKKMTDKDKICCELPMDLSMKVDDIDRE